MATGGRTVAYPSSKERTNYARLCRAIIDLGTDVLRDVLTNLIPPGQIHHAAQTCRNLKLNPSQRSTINTAVLQDYAQFDVSLLYILIRKLCPTIAPTNGWTHGTPPGQSETTEGDDVKRIHYIRNTIYGHLSDTCISDDHFNLFWQMIQDVMARMDARFGTQHDQQLSHIQTFCMDDVTEANYIQTVQDMKEADRELRSAVQQLERKMQHLTEFQRLGADNQDTTLSMIDDHRKDKTFLLTKAVTVGLKKLEENGVLIYSGVAGSGKTSNALEVAKQFLDLHPDHVARNVNDVTKWESYISPGDYTLVIFDDFLGSTNVNTNVVKEGKKYWKQIHACVQSGKLKVIMTTRHHMLEECLSELETSKMFGKKNIINLSIGDYELSFDEREKMLKLHAEMNKIKIEYLNDKENYSAEEVLDEEITVTIDYYTVNKIIKSDPLIGFPQALFLFCSNRKYTRLGASFFLHPAQSLVNEIDNLKESDKVRENLKYCILVYMLMKNKEIDLDKIDDEIWSYVIKTFLLQVASSDVIIKVVVNSLINKYITNVGGTYVYKFKHETILEAVAVSLGNSSTELLLKYSDIRLIHEFVRTKNYSVKEGEIIIMLKSTSEYVPLIHRFIQGMTNRENYQWLSHPAVDDIEFVKCLISTIQSNEEYVEIVRKHCSKSNGIFWDACRYDRYHLVDILYTHFHQYISTRNCLLDAELTTTKWLLDHQLDTDSIAKVLEYISDTFWTEKLDMILNHPVVKLTHITQFIDRHGMPCCTEYSTVKVILDRWPDIDVKYVMKLLSLVFMYVWGSTDELNVIVNHLALQMTHLTQYLDRHGVPRFTDYSTVKIILDRWPGIDVKYVVKLLSHVFLRGRGTKEELIAMLNHPVVQLPHLAQYIDRHGLPDEATDRLKFILDALPNVDPKYVNGLMLCFLDSDTTEELNVMLNHPALQLTHLKHYIEIHDAPKRTDYSTVIDILDRWPYIDAKYVVRLLSHVFKLRRGTTEKLNVMFTRPALQLAHLTQCIDRHGVSRSTDSSTVIAILDRWPDIDEKYVVKLLSHAFRFGRGTTEKLNVMFTRPALQLAHLTQCIDRYGVPRSTDSSTVIVILDRWPGIDVKYVVKLLSHVFRLGTGTIEKLNVMFTHPALQLTHLTQYIDIECIPFCTNYSTVTVILDRWLDIDVKYVVELLSGVFGFGKDTTEELNDMLSHPTLKLTHLTQYIDRHGVPSGTDNSTVIVILDRWPDIGMKYVEKFLFEMKWKRDKEAIKLLESFIRKRKNKCSLQ